MSYKVPIIKPINELNLQTGDYSKNVYSTTYHSTYSSINTDNSVYADTGRISKCNSSKNLRTIKEFNDKKNENLGIKIFKEQFKTLDLSNVNSDEKSDIQRIKRIQLPSSKRTLEPELRHENKVVSSKRCFSTRGVNSPGNISTLIRKTDKEESITKCKKTPNPKVYNSINIMHDTNDKDNYKRGIGASEYKRYDHTTQIVALPGGKKRDKYSIKDDQKFLNKTNEGHVLKMMRDYNSHIVCLPNSQTMPNHPTLHKFGKYYDRRHQINKSEEDLVSSYKYNSFKTANKIESRNPTEVDKPFGIASGVKAGPSVYRMKRPDNIRDQFSSQITFN